MSRCLLSRLAATIAFLGLASVSYAQVVTFTWAGKEQDAYWYDASSWHAGLFPADDIATTRILFGPGPAGHLDYDEILAHQLSFEGITNWFELHGGYDTTHLGSGGIVYNPAGPITSWISDRVQLHANQIWDIKGGTLVIEGAITDEFLDLQSETWVSGNYRITKNGAGTLALDTESDGYWTGGVTLNAGTLALSSYVGYYQGLGTGTLIINGGTLATFDEYDEDDDSYVENNIEVNNGVLRTRNRGELQLGYSGEGESTITLNADTTLDTAGRPLFLSGNVTESGGPRKLTVNGTGAVIVDGSANWTGGTHVEKGVLILAPWNNTLPTGNITATSSGYVGVGTGIEPASLLAKVDAVNFVGTVGFDSEDRWEVETVVSPIDLSGKNASIRLGSATHARLGYLRDQEFQVISSATITPFGNTYRFGGGGGTLYVETQLTDDEATPRNVAVESPREAPLLVKFESPENNYSGSTSVTHSGLVFTGNTNVPAGTGSIAVNEGGYVGFEFWGDQTTQQFVDNSLAKVASGSTGMVGFDGIEGGIDAAIDLSGFTNPAGIWLGTSTGVLGEEYRSPGVVLTGAITPAGNTYRFAGYKGGFLEVASTLTGASNVVIGDPASLGTMGDFLNEQYSTVRLSGANTHSGSTTLFMGELQLTDNALGTGGLVVQPHTFTEFPQGEDDVRPQITSLGNVAINNGFQVNADVTLFGGESSFTIDSNITGSGEIYTDGLVALTLNGNNSAFSGGFYFSGNSYVYANTNTALGTGPIGVGYSYNTQITFGADAAAPSVGGFFSNEEGDYLSVNLLAENAHLTINQPADGVFYGDIVSGSTGNTMRVIKNGPGDLELRYGNLGYRYTGDVFTPSQGTVEASLPGSPNVILQVNQGNLTLDDYYVAHPSSTIWINGGTLTTTSYTHLDNPIAFTNGRLAGNGSFNSVTIGATATLAPGVGANAIGMMNFNDLTLAGGGLLEWNLRSADPALGDHDLITISTPSTLHVTATADNPETPGDERFTLKLISLGADGLPGTVTGISGERSYTWTIFDATWSSIEGFDPSKFVIDASQFFTDVDPSTFELSVSPDGKLVQLTFQAVPEPSTYALLAIGLGMVVLAYRRRFSPRRSS